MSVSYSSFHSSVVEHSGEHRDEIITHSHSILETVSDSQQQIGGPGAESTEGQSVSHPIAAAPSIYSTAATTGTTGTTVTTTPPSGRLPVTDSDHEAWYGQDCIKIAA